VRLFASSDLHKQNMCEDGARTQLLNVPLSRSSTRN
jgi:hypothetical protein